ncbi:cytochrome aa3 quinol oxidase subunit II [Gracilibacillus alcaliphilus]|uniref:cytochrome aa3 quinol oxidase subunit II n=1 Tax=Gracilibacillus alcaliphilus TaxID=1401441 RepID=UPI001956B7E1|nr:cytochrome aa3 quinol oxidase subunit II [Gracilibacillus alcaliphilus]MBM7675366.1 cytochrome aa3-600 menaquinol oxidase subunit 2 [Gracilibacillus alcaliphilus]
MTAMKKLLYTFTLLLLPVFLAGCESKLLVFDPKGPIARSLTDLIIYSIIFMLVIVVVIFVLFGYFIWKYRARKDDGDFEPKEEKGNHWLEITWFTIPVLIVIALMIPTAKTIYEVEDVPQGYEEEEPLVIHVTSADWKWIFSYPDQDIETVNYINIPADHPVQFKMTSAGTMQSFWVPELAGQKYTMANMQTELYMVADKPGTFYGRNTNFNGQGYAHMTFDVEALEKDDFNEWVNDVKNTAYDLTEDQYGELLEPSVLGRMTFNGTHLDWIDHAHGGSEQYIDPELYKEYHQEGFQDGEVPVREIEQSGVREETDNEQETHQQHETEASEQGAHEHHDMEQDSESDTADHSHH